ncbi:MAG TPA: hypothetical protein VKG38_08335 [Solirubrobacteraceae bacterium]|nr:hypothetical protein [Solirubrobacteraceae bacterium]
MKRIGIVGLCLAVASIMSAVATAPASAASPVGTSFVTVSTGLSYAHTLTITSYDSTTGAISGTLTRPKGLVAGTVNESVSPATITMQWQYQDGSGYTAKLSGTIASNGAMSGTGSGSDALKWTWSSVANAGTGEYVKCVKTQKVDKKYTGDYTTDTCTARGKTGESKYELAEVARATSQDTTKIAHLANVVGGEVTCTKGSGTDEVAVPTEVDETVHFTGCALSSTGGTCTTTGDSAGEITFASFSRLIGHGEKGPSGGEPVIGEVWDSLESTMAFRGEEPYETEYICEAKYLVRTHGTVSGSVAPVDAKPSHKGTLAFEEHKGEQSLVTEYSENGGASWKPASASTFAATIKIKWSEGLEART